MILKPTHTHTLYVYVCHSLVCLCLGKLKHYVRHTHTYRSIFSLLHTCHSTPLFPMCVRTQFPLLEYQTFPVSTRPNGKNVWKSFSWLHADARTHTKEHFKLTMLTLYFFLEPFHLHAVRGQQCVPAER